MRGVLIAIQGKDAERFIRMMKTYGANKRKLTKVEKEAAKWVDAEMQHFSETKIPRCLECKVDYIQLDAHTWKPNCKCIKQDVRLSIG